MKHWIVLTGIALLGAAAVVVSERRKVDVPAGPSAMLYLIADSQQELTRLPVTFTRLSDEEEIRIGDRLAASYAEQQPTQNPESVEVLRYVSRVGYQVAAHAHRKLPYKFHYIPSDYFVNAFALPGGHVYIGAGLVALMDSEDELAAVLGHEVEHIDHYHCAERAQQQEALRKIPLGELVAIPIEVFEAGYSKDQELEADREGTRLAVETGYSPNGAVRMFETFERLYQEYQTRAKTPQEELSRVALQTLEGYFRSHPLPAERIAQVQKLIADEHWHLGPERNLEVAYIFWTAKAEAALDGHEYPQAQQLAVHSLQLHPNQAKALEILARSQFAQADFARAAGTYRKLLDLAPIRTDVANAYALALAAADRKSAATEFGGWMDSIKGDKPRDLRVPLAGLALVAGDAGPAREAIAAAKSAETVNTTEWAARWLGELAWWYYLAGDYSDAHDLLDTAAQLRPEEIRFKTSQAWVNIENRRLADALRNLDASYDLYSKTTHPERIMARSIAHWLARQPDQALEEYESGVTAQPEWENEKWVRALYSPLVAQSLQEIQAERQLRHKARQARAH
jgi:beta-barrel assembly-enhancing protease